jgi:Ni,Fe-hydrogenase III small subunit/Pyruvate/2-oxoacid:ferredoxin oxidoreductase delta subunit
MLKALLARLKQGSATVDFPSEAVQLSDRFRGLPVIDQSKCGEGCRACAETCPTDAITITDRLRLDLGRCLFCGLCAESCPTGAIRYTPDFRLAVRKKEDLILGESELKLAEALDAKMRRLFGRSLKLRQVSAGGCNGCEVEVNATENIIFDIGRFGIQIVVSPRHADGLLVTGPVTENMKLALQKTYAAVPDPKLVIAVGACAISGGPYFNRLEQHNGADSTVPVDLYIPGCPPHPLTILDGLLRLLGRIEERRED